MTMAAFLAGCQAPPQPEGATDLVVRIADREAFFDDTLTRLREADFPPRYADRAEGVVIAGPTTSGQWFEWWRVDAPGAYQSLESSLSTIRRTVTVRLSPADGGAAAAGGGELGGGPYRLSVQVDKERYSAPERQATTALGAMAIYNERLPTTEGLRNARSVGEHWIPLGRDALLEAHLLDRIASVAGVRVVQAADGP